MITANPHHQITPPAPGPDKRPRRSAQPTERDVQVHHGAYCFGVAFFSWHLPKVLIRKSAIRARSGASTLKDQYLGQVPGGGYAREDARGKSPILNLDISLVQQGSIHRRWSCHGEKRTQDHH